MRKLGEQWIEEIDGYRHLVKLSKSNFKEIGTCGGCIHHSWYEGDWCDVSTSKPCGDVGCIIKDLGVLNEDGCLPAPWDETKYPKITVLIGNVYNIEVMEGFWFMQVRGDTLEKAIERWNRRA